MLDQYRQDLNNDQDNLGENRYQSSKRKVVFTLAGGALALLFFLFIIGAFRSEDEGTAEKDQTAAVATELTDLQARVEKLEQMLQGSSALATAKPNNPELSLNNGQLTDNALKALIASTATDANQQESLAASDSDAMQPTEIPAPAPTTAPAPKAAAVQPRSYTIQKGDTLSKISQKCYGTTKKWKQIYDANRDRISNINQLKVGTQLSIPEDPTTNK